MTETITYDEARQIDLPRNPFRRHKVVQKLITDLKMPGVDVSYIPRPLKGRRDLEEYAIAHEAALQVYSEEPPITYPVGFGTLRGYITVHPREENNGENI